MKGAAESSPLPNHAPRRRPRVVRVGEVVGWFAGVVCTYWLYWLIAVPLIEPGIELAAANFSSQDDAVAARQAKSARKQTLERYFPPGSWELVNPAIWETNQTLLLFKDPKPLPDGTVELEHCTLLFFPQPRNDEDADVQPIVMRAAEGATLKFDQPIVLKTVDLAKRKLVGGRLKGLITIERAPTEPGTDDALLITTRDVELQGNRAFSPHVVKFRFGQSRGSGRNLEIFLDADDGGGLRNGRVKSLHIKRDVVAYLALDDPALARGRQAAPRPELQGSTLKITCQDEFRFDFQQYAASFHERVDVERSTVGPSDLLNCEVLTVFFRRNSDEAGTANPQQRSGAAAEVDDVPIRYIEARGDPVVLQSPSRGVYVRCHRSLEFHPLPGNPFGRLVATGPGVMRGVAPGDSPAEYQVQWTREVRFEPAEGEQYVASLRGGATVRVSDLGEVTAGDVLGKDGRIVEEGRIVAWVTPLSQPAHSQPVARVVPASMHRPLPGPANAGARVGAHGIAPPSATLGPTHRTLRKPVIAAADDASTERQTGPPPGRGTKWQIDRVMAQGNVEVDVPQLDAKTRKLEVWIDRLKQTAVGPSIAEQSPPAPTDQPPAGESKTAAREAPSQRFEVRSGSVQARLIPRGKQYDVAALTLDNTAHLQELSPRPGTKPMVVDGQQVHVVGANTEQTTVKVSGRPAQIEAGGMVLLGEAIYLEKHTNRLWIDGPGRMIMPIDQDLNGKPLAAPQSAEVSWQGAMHFESKSVTFRRDVRVQSNQQLLTTQQLEGVLDRAIDFSNPGSAAPGPGKSNVQSGPQLAFVRCYGEAVLDSREFNEQGQKTAVDQMQVFDLSINRTTGEVHGKGPGWVRHVGLETGGSPLGRLAAPGTNAQPTRPAARRPGLTYLHVQFQRAIHGNINGRRLTFGEPTKTVYAPVSDWNARLSPDDPASLGPEGMILDAQTLTVREMPARTPGEDGWFELVAIGNVLAEGAQFAALGHRVTYTQDKDQMILEGDGRSPAEVSYSAIEGGRRNEARADKIIYAVGMRHIIFSGAHSLNVDVPRPPNDAAK